MTGQIQDTFLYNGEKYELVAFKGESLLLLKCMVWSQRHFIQLAGGDSSQHMKSQIKVYFLFK